MDMILPSTGVRVFAYDAGRPVRSDSLPTIVMIHGAGQEHSIWAQQSRWLAWRGYPILAVDLPAHGRSAALPTGLIDSVPAFADWLISLLQTLQIQQCVLIGNSMGSLIALETAARLADADAQSQVTVRAVALLGTAAPMKVSAMLLDGSKANDPKVHEWITIWSHAPQTPYRASPIPGLSLYDTALALLDRTAPGVLHHDFVACNAYTQGATQAAKVAAPTLVLSGQKDMMTPPKAAMPLAQALPQGTMVTLPNVGHSMMAEAPRAVQLQLAHLLQKIV